jgi:competence protein ComEA
VLTLAVAGLTGLIGGLALVVLLLTATSTGDEASMAGSAGAPLAAGPIDGGVVDAGLSSEDDGPQLVVDVAGAVMRPGLVRLRRGGRVGDAIAGAGGFDPRVDLAETGRTLNLAEALVDGAKVVVPELGAQAVGPNAPGDGLIDLNTADQATLEGLPGIGPVTATRIIEAREQQRFASVEDLLSRDVVGEAVFEDIQGLVRASG